MFCSIPMIYIPGFLGGSDDKESACSAGDPGSIPGSGRSLGEGNNYPLQCSCLENSMNRGTWFAEMHGIPKSQTQLSHGTTNGKCMRAPPSGLLIILT